MPSPTCIDLIEFQARRAHYNLLKLCFCTEGWREGRWLRVLQAGRVVRGQAEMKDKGSVDSNMWDLEMARRWRDVAKP